MSEATNGSHGSRVTARSPFIKLAADLVLARVANSIAFCPFKGRGSNESAIYLARQIQIIGLRTMCAGEIRFSKRQCSTVNGKH